MSTQQICSLIVSALFFIIFGSTLASASAAIDYAHISQGVSVEMVGPGIREAPYDVYGALGYGEYLIYKSHPTPQNPNWFILRFNDIQEIQAISIQWRFVYLETVFKIEYLSPEGQWHEFVPEKDTGLYGKEFFYTLSAPVKASKIKFTATGISDKWDAGVAINSFQVFSSTHIPDLVQRAEELVLRITNEIHDVLEIWEDVRDSNEVSGIKNDIEKYSKEELYFQGFQEKLNSDKPISKEEWDEVFYSIEELTYKLRETYALLRRVQLKKLAGNAEYAVGISDPITKIPREFFKGVLSDKVILEGAKKEYVSFQIVLIPTGKELSNVNVEVTDLKAGNGTISKGNIEISRVGYVKTEAPSPVSLDNIEGLPYAGWWPDILMPMRSCDVIIGEVQPIWITIYIPEGSSAGEYQGKIKINPKNSVAKEIEVSLRVWDFDLPKTGHLRNIFSLSWSTTQGYLGKLPSLDLWRGYYEFLMKKRINPTSLYSKMIPEKNEIDYALDLGMNTFNIGYIYSASDRATDWYFENLLKDVEMWIPLIEKNDLYDKAVIYLADEPSRTQAVYDIINSRAQVFNERFPNLKKMLVLTRPIDSKFYGSVDIWVPIIPDAWDDDLARERKAKREDVWWYSVGWGLNIDSTAIAPRIWSWLSWKHDVDGILYWVLQAGWNQQNKNWWGPWWWPLSDAGTSTKWNPEGHNGCNGAGNLVYPWKDNTMLSSIRLELLRDGMQDYEYLYKLEELIKEVEKKNSVTEEVLKEAKALVEIESGIADDFKSYTRLPEELLKYKRRLGEMIERLQKSLH